MTRKRLRMREMTHFTATLKWRGIHTPAHEITLLNEKIDLSLRRCFLMCEIIYDTNNRKKYVDVQMNCIKNIKNSICCVKAVILQLTLSCDTKLYSH